MIDLLLFPSVETPFSKADKTKVLFLRNTLLLAETIDLISAFSFSVVSYFLRVWIQNFFFGCLKGCRRARRKRRLTSPEEYRESPAPVPASEPACSDPSLCSRSLPHRG